MTNQRTFTLDDFRRWGAIGGAKHKPKRISHAEAVRLAKLSVSARRKSRAVR
jgi:hypothetical protein